jgi:hypothetical protein
MCAGNIKESITVNNLHITIYGYKKTRDLNLGFLLSCY